MPTSRFARNHSAQDRSSAPSEGVHQLSILTGYGNISTAVNAVKLGAVDYLAKPVDADDVAATLLAPDNKSSFVASGGAAGPARNSHPIRLVVPMRPRVRHRIKAFLASPTVSSQSP